MRIAIIGNGPPKVDLASRIDSHDIVIRFNNAVGVGGLNGTKTSIIALVNHGGQPGEWLQTKDFLRRPEISGASRALFPFQRDDGLHQCYSRSLEHFLSTIGLRAFYLPAYAEARFRACLHDLNGIIGAPPSTGALVMFWVLTLLGRRKSAHPVSVSGFEFKGWSGHDWTSENLWFDKLVANRRVHVM